MILLGTKCDMESDRQVSREEAQALADENGMKYFETSAKANINVKEAFQEMIDRVYQTKFKDEAQTGGSSTPNRTRNEVTHGSFKISRSSSQVPNDDDRKGRGCKC